METEFIPYKQALALKRLGFNVKCCGRYYDEYEGKNELMTFFPHHCKDYNGVLVDANPKSFFFGRASNSPYVSVPTYSQSFKWFREKQSLYPEIMIDQTSSPKFCFKISEFTGNPKDLSETEWSWNQIPNDADWGLDRTYEEAELACLIKLIELCQK